MKWIFLLSLLYLNYYTYSQPNRSPHGTLLFAAVFKDGIVMAADSRASFEGFDTVLKKSIVYAYIDSVQKIYPIGNYQIAISGEAHLLDYSWHYLVSRFNKKHKKKLTVEKTLESFFSFIKRKYKASDSTLQANGFIIAGYEDSTPVAIIKHKNFEKESVKLNISVSTHDCFEKYVNAKRRAIASETANSLDSTFRKCTKDDISIGGPTTVLILRHGNLVSYVNQFPFVPNRNLEDFSRDIINEKVFVNYVYPYSKKLLFRLLSR